MSDIEQRVKELIMEKVGVDESKIVTNASFGDDLGLDSLDLVELVMAIEEKFGCEISDEDQMKIQKVGDAIDYIKKHLEETTVN